MSKHIKINLLIVLITIPVAAWLTYRLFQDYQSRDLVSTNISTIGLQAVVGLLFIIGSCELL